MGFTADLNLSTGYQATTIKVMLHTITFTGVDSRTDIRELAKLTQWWANNPSLPNTTLEFGFLINGNPTETRNRFHHPTEMGAFTLSDAGAGVALHLCGLFCREVMLTGWMEHSARFFHKGLLSRPDRIQLNAPKDTLQTALPLAFHRRDKEVMGIRSILQMNNANEAEILRRIVSEEGDYFDLLWDQSGGRGKVLDVQEAVRRMPRTTKKYILPAYAGGIHPGNVAEIVRQLDMHHGPTPYGIDMESGVRDSQDWFDIGKVREVLNNILKNYEV